MEKQAHHYLQIAKKHKKKIFIFSGAFFLFLFFVFTLMVKTNVFTSVDFDLTVKLQGKTPLKMDPLYMNLSTVASVYGLSIILAIILIVRRRLMGIAVFIIFLGSHAIELIGKLFLHQPGPPFQFFRHGGGRAEF